jgi:cytochrome c oxidase assembly protein subunit 15
MSPLADTLADTSAAIAADTEWRLALGPARRRRLRLWFVSGAALTVLIVVIGGITRLTQSGLSIVDWKPFMGVVPPLSEAEWQEAFAAYQRFPEYQKLRPEMTLADFEFIFFWEYLHRMVARLIGLVFLVPFLVFWARGYFSRPLMRRVLLLFALGAAQGFMGWFMVRSGLVDDPRVSHFRLAAHFAIALTIFGYCLWLVREMSVPAGQGRAAVEHSAMGAVYGLGALLALQIVWGAFVAGLHAGLIFNTFPQMAGRWLPPQGWQMQPGWINLLENPATVQWVHRALGTVLLFAALGVWWRTRQTAGKTVRHLAGGFAALVALQYTLGVFTLLYAVPVALGVLHQATVVAVLGVWIVWLHHALRPPVPAA